MWLQYFILSDRLLLWASWATVLYIINSAAQERMHWHASVSDGDRSVDAVNDRLPTVYVCSKDVDDMQNTNDRPNSDQVEGLQAEIIVSERSRLRLLCAAGHCDSSKPWSPRWR